MLFFCVRKQQQINRFENKKTKLKKKTKIFLVFKNNSKSPYKKNVPFFAFFFVAFGWGGIKKTFSVANGGSLLREKKHIFQKFQIDLFKVP